MKNNSHISDSKFQTPVCLTIAGVDPSGGAGIIADIKTFTSFGCFATAAIASLTFQNTTGVFGALHQSAETVRAQIEPVIQDFDVAALKTGMLPTREIIEEISRIVRERGLKNFVVDPVVRSTSGFDLIDDDALKSLIEKLFPLAEVITPNIPEAERISEMKIETESDIRRAARVMQNLGARAVIIKGGHLPSNAGEKRNPPLEDTSNGIYKAPQTSGNKRIAADYLFIGNDIFIFSEEFIETTATHGTGCTFAAAITASLAKGKNLYEAVGTAKRFVTEAIRTAPHLGRGFSPVNHSILDFVV